MKMPALTRKSIADVTRRRGRTIIVILGILIGVFGLTAINVTSDAIQNALDTSLSKAGLSPTITTAQQYKDRNLAQFQIIYLVLYAVAAIIALVGILGLFNTLTTSVFERRREIGILRSMGASGWRVGRVFWLEGLSLAVIAWLVAIVLASQAPTPS